jgi:hypothetical protein
MVTKVKLETVVAPLSVLDCNLRLTGSRTPARPAELMLMMVSALWLTGRKPTIICYKSGVSAVHCATFAYTIDFPLLMIYVGMRADEARDQHA